MTGRRGRGRPNMTGKRQVEEHIDQITLKKENAIEGTKRRDGVYKLLKSMRSIRQPALTQTNRI